MGKKKDLEGRTAIEPKGPLAISPLIWFAVPLVWVGGICAAGILSEKTKYSQEKREIESTYSIKQDSLWQTHSAKMDSLEKSYIIDMKNFEEKHGEELSPHLKQRLEHYNKK